MTGRSRVARHAGAPRKVSARRPALAGLVAVLGLATAGSAAAYWTSGGRSTGTATSATTRLTAVAGTAAGLYPGGSVPVPVTVTNDGSGPVALTSVAIGSVAAAPVAGCADAVSVPRLTEGLPTVAPGSPATVTLVVSMAVDARNRCQGATFTLSVTTTGTQR